MVLADDFHLRLLFVGPPVALMIAAGLWSLLLDDLWPSAPTERHHHE